MSTVSSDALRKYELMLILSGELTEADFMKELDEIRKLLKESTHSVTHEDVWGRRNFSYRLKKQRDGYYAVFNFAAEPTGIAELRNTMGLNPHVLRNLFVSVPDDYVPTRYKEEPRVTAEKPRMHPKPAMKPAMKPVPMELRMAEPEKPLVAGKADEEELKKVEKKLEEILDNPDIDIK